MINIAASCRNCQFAEKFEHRDVKIVEKRIFGGDKTTICSGYTEILCHRYPKMVTTFDTYWCGEYREKQSTNDY